MDLRFSFWLLCTFKLLLPFVNPSQGKSHKLAFPTSLAARIQACDLGCINQMHASEIFKLQASDTNKQVQHRTILVRRTANKPVFGERAAREVLAALSVFQCGRWLSYLYLEAGSTQGLSVVWGGHRFWLGSPQAWFSGPPWKSEYNLICFNILLFPLM